MSDHMQLGPILRTGPDGALDWRRVSSSAKNLEAISRAIDQHNENCPYPAAEVRMNPYEAERLGWEEIRGLPVVADPELGTGRFRIVCSRDDAGEGVEEAEALGIPVEVAAPGGRPSPE
jgi:hypothetical protein